MAESNKIIIATGTYPPEVSGQSSFVSRLRKSLMEAGQKVCVVSYSSAKQSDYEQEVFLIKRNFWRHFRYFWRLFSLAQPGDIIYAQDLFSSGWPAALAKRRGVRLFIRLGGDFLWEKMVNSGHCQVPLSQYYQQPKSLLEKFYLMVYRFVLRRADLLIFNTVWQKELYQKNFSVLPKQLAVIENSLPEELQNTGEPSFAELTESAPYLFAGRFISMKNLLRLLSAFKQTDLKRELWLIGAGPQEEDLKALAAADSRIKILPARSFVYLLPLIKKAYCLIIPSLTELNPNLAVEATLLKKPVILTQEVGFSEKIKDIFLLIDPLSENSIKNALLSMAEENFYQQRLASLAEFSGFPAWLEVVEKHLTLFSLK